MSKTRCLKLSQIAERLAAEISSSYRNLHAQVAGGQVRFRGTFPVRSDGKILDRFQVEIEIPRNFPRTWPTVREVGGRIPKIPDRHIHPDGSACLFLDEEARTQFPNGLSFLEFLDGPVHNYFLSQAHYEVHGDWPFGERAHGAEGVLDFYSELLGVSDRTVLRRYIECLARQNYKGHHPCPCGNGKRLRDCHSEQVKALRRTISPKVAMASLLQIRG